MSGVGADSHAAGNARADLPSELSDVEPGSAFRLADWTLITVTYNSEGQLERYWRNLPADAIDWLVVDNASHDRSANLARELGARTIECDTNRGFSAANNIGLAATETKYVAFVNPDVAVDLESLRLLAATIDRTNGIVAPQLTNSDGSLQPNSRGLPFLVDKLAHRGIRLPGARLEDYIAVRPTETPYFVGWVMGAVVAGTTETFRRVGGWNSDFFVYYEDVGSPGTELEFAL